MSNFQVPVKLYMTADVITVSPSDSLTRAYELTTDRRVSSLAVTDDGRLVGLISRRDLLRVGRRAAAFGTDAPVLTFPSQTVGDEMTTNVRTVEPGTDLEEAARIMRKEYIHRVFVTDGGTLVGVLSTRDLMHALTEKKTNRRVGEFMSSPVFTIRDEETLGEAVERLDRAHVSGLIVIEEDWPVGIFSQTEALDARDLPPTVAVGDVMNPRILVLPSTTTLHRAAAQAAALEVRRVVIQDGHEVRGILSGLDFASAVA